MGVFSVGQVVPPENPTRGSGRKISWSGQDGEGFGKIRVASKFGIGEVGGVKSGQRVVDLVVSGQNI